MRTAPVLQEGRAGSSRPPAPVCPTCSRPRRCSSAVVWLRRVRPSRAAKARPERKPRGAPIASTVRRATTGPAEGASISLRRL